MRVLVLGAGYAGVALARSLEERLPPEATLVVVNDADAHLVQHLVHRVIRRPDAADVLRVPLVDVFDRAEVVVGSVDAIDRSARRVELDGDDLDYDYAAVCLGARTAYRGLPGVRDHATPLKRVEHALRIREDFRSVCESGGTAVVGGAGLSGVQVAGELVELAAEWDAADVRVLLLEQESDVAPSFPPPFRRTVRAALEERDVEVRTGAVVERATDDAVVLADGELPYDQFVWTGGITGTPAMGGDRPVVRADLRLDRTAFAVGDAARVVDADGEAAPASAATAIRQARVAATNVCRLVDHDLSDRDAFAPRLKRYRHEVPGWVVSVGDAAVAQLGPTVVTGAAAKAAKTTVGADYLRSVGAVRNAIELVESEFD